MAREYFCAYHSYLKNMNRLTDEECGKLFRALLEYSRTGEEPELDGNEGFVFDGIKENIDREIAKYEDKSRSARENGKKGGRPGKGAGEEINPKNPVGLSETQKTQEEEKEEEEDKEEDKDKEKELSDDLRRYTTDVVTTKVVTTDVAPNEADMSDAGITDAYSSEDAAERVSRVPYREIAALYNSICVSLPKAVSLSEKRKKTLNARWRDAGGDIGEFRRVFELAEASDFLRGKTEGRNGATFIADFGWIIRPSNFEKIREGRYDNRAAKPPVDCGKTDNGYVVPDKWKGVFTEA